MLVEVAIEYINYFVALLFVICYSYQFFYIFITFFRKPVKFPKAPNNKRYAFMVAARNEEVVIGKLVESIREQHYPEEFIDIYVCADNCTDNTAFVAKEAGAIVYERFNKKQVGKGYALDFLFSKVTEMCGDDYYAGFFIFDADNLLDKRYVHEMNKALCAGHNIVTSYRNSKNFDANWISSGYALWFLREAKHLNNARMILGTSCAVSGTGFLVSSEIIKRNGGWKFFLLTEDIEFSIDSIIKGEKIAYCHSAKFYDEQPEKFVASWNQRIRWTKGYMQVFRRYGGKLLGGLFGNNGFSCFDMSMTIMPACVLTIFSFFVNIITIVLSLVTGSEPVAVLLSTLESVRNSLIMMLSIGFITCISEWREIRTVWWKKLLYCITFPLFMITYIPIAIAALFTKGQWKPIKHVNSTSISEMEGKKPKKLKSKRVRAIEEKSSDVKD